MSTEKDMYTFHSNIKLLKEKLNIEKINTGKQYTTKFGLVYDDIERLHALVGVDGCLHLKSGTEFSSIQYRGQNEDFGVCKSSLYRLESVEEQFLSICQTIAFEELLESHPFIKFARSMPLDKNQLCLNFTGIAQHYGLATDYLDITNNFDVACFFATCKYMDGQYYPIGNIKKAGIIYKINELLLPPFIESKDNQDIELEYLGWQPLPRPEEQRASVLQIIKGTDLDNIRSIEKHYFKHSISKSKKIWKQFDEGKALFPDDSAADLSNECKKLNSFTEQQIKKAFERFEVWNIKTIENKEQMLDKLKIETIENNGLSWNSLVDIKQEYWEEKFYQTMSKVGFRMTSPHIQLD